MFKKILQSLTKSQSAKVSASTVSSPKPSAGVSASAVAPVAGIKGATAQADGTRTPEELCGITPKMPKGEVMQRLKKLYLRHNRGASSLDPKVRAQAEEMLKAIVVMREKHFGQI